MGSLYDCRPVRLDERAAGCAMNDLQADGKVNTKCAHHRQRRRLNTYRTVVHVEGGSFRGKPVRLSLEVKEVAAINAQFERVDHSVRY